MHSDSPPKGNAGGKVSSSRDRDKEVLKVETKPRASLTDSDWTEHYLFVVDCASFSNIKV